MKRNSLVAALALALASTGLASTAAEAGSGTIVTVLPFRYQPDPIEITSGDTLTFVNADSLSGEGHSVTHAVAVGSELFKTPIIPTGSQAPVAGVEDLPAGEYRFTCRVHAFMNGVLVVR